MTRSEMVRKLQGYVFDASDSTAQLNFEDASLLLAFIEKAGMLPPSYCVERTGTGIGAAVALTRVDGKWEPEETTEDKINKTWRPG